MNIMTREQWLKLPYRVRLWRTLFCGHPFEQSMKIGAVLDTYNVRPPDNHREFKYVINVRRCAICRKYFMDHGYQYIK